jgi:hypothetical protein
MKKGLFVGALAGAAFWGANEFIPTTKSDITDNLINLAVAAVVGMVAGKFLHQ